MNYTYSKKAMLQLLSIVRYIESKNTIGSGERWLQKYENFLYKELVNHKIIPVCKNATFYKLKLQCIKFNDWTIAISVSKNILRIEAILHKSRIKN